MYNPFLCFTNPKTGIISEIFETINNFTTPRPKRLLLCNNETSECEEVLRVLLYVDGMVVDKTQNDNIGTGFFSFLF